MSRAAMLKDLARSGLTKTDATKLGLKLLSRDANEKLTGFYVPGYLIPYTNINKKKVKDAWRVRHLEDIPGKFGSVRAKPVRYTGPKGQLPHLYFPANFGNWAGLAKDTDETIYITEGEKKASCLCKNGFPCIAVPGVWGWKSKKHGVRIIKDFNAVDWTDRSVAMVFDNDVIIKPEVLGALNALANELTEKGASVYILHLPQGKLKGVDDFLVAKGVDKFQSLRITGFEGSENLWKFQETVAYVKANNYFVDVEDLRTFPDMSKLRQAFGNLSYEVPKADGEGTKTVYVVDEWLKWDLRRTHTKMVFAPGEPATIGKELNTWRNWGCEPKKGSVKPFIDLVKYIFANEPAVIGWFMQWLAYPLQVPGTKLQTGVLIWSQSEGVGKTFIGEIMRGIYGEHFSRIEKEDIVGEWNDWLINKQFILGEEITGGDSRHVADKVKNMITRNTAISKIKYQATFQINDCANYFLTSNHEDSLHLSGKDRRWLVVHVDEEKQHDKWYKAINDWKANGGAAHLFFHLLTEIDTTNFNPMAAAPQTSSKVEMADLSKSSLEMQLEAVLNNPDEHLKFGGLRFERDVYTVSELIQMLDLAKNTHNPISRILTKRRTPKCKTKERRLVALRNQEYWRKATGTEWTENYMLDFKANKYTKENEK